MKASWKRKWTGANRKGAGNESGNESGNEPEMEAEMEADMGRK